VTLERILGENKQLRDALAETAKTLADMRRNLAATSGESEIFKRQSMELKLRMEALGLDLAGGNNAKLEQRLLTLVSDLPRDGRREETTLRGNHPAFRGGSLYA
jgi:hypothetical protein